MQGSKKRILLVEDHPGTIDVVRTELQFLGYDVLIAQSGMKAVELAIRELPDLIIMDIRLPDMNGLTAVSQIRNHPATKNIPILAATVNSLPRDREQCLAAGCSDYIAKPFTHNELGETIRKLLSEKKRGETKTRKQS